MPVGSADVGKLMLDRSTNPSWDISTVRLKVRRFMPVGSADLPTFLS